jgi:Mg-chelatase subunit ChlD
MASQYKSSDERIIPVAIPLPISTAIHDGTIPTAPTARPTLETANATMSSPISEQQISKLVEQGYTRGHAISLAQTIKNFPLRLWVVDNSGSMQTADGHRFVETKRTQDVKIVKCSRWHELRDCIEYHAHMAAALEAPTTFRMLNNPGCGPNTQQFGIAETSLTPAVLQEEVDRAVAIMKSAQPHGVTPLIQHLEVIQQSVYEIAPTLRADGCRVVIILATDGLPTDMNGNCSETIQQQFVEALRALEGLPVWVVIRLCTDEEKVVNFYNNLDGQLELSLEVLDDFQEEAKGVHEHNPWLNYALQLHRLREMGYHHRVFDMMDERPFTHEELREFCTLLLLDENSSAAELPDPSADWRLFSNTVKKLLAKQRGQWNPIQKKVTPWIDIKEMNKIFCKHGRWSLW